MLGTLRGKLVGGEEGLSIDVFSLVFIVAFPVVFFLYICSILCFDKYGGRSPARRAHLCNGKRGHKHSSSVWFAPFVSMAWLEFFDHRASLVGFARRARISLDWFGFGISRSTFVSRFVGYVLLVLYTRPCTCFFVSYPSSIFLLVRRLFTLDLIGFDHSCVEVSGALLGHAFLCDARPCTWTIHELPFVCYSML